MDNLIQARVARGVGCGSCGSVVPLVLLVRVIEGARTGTSDRADTGTLSSSGQSTDRGSTRGPDANSPGGVYVTFVLNPPTVTAVVAHSSDSGDDGWTGQKR
jgi:hypothetical protein